MDIHPELLEPGLAGPVQALWSQRYTDFPPSVPKCAFAMDRFLCTPPTSSSKRWSAEFFLSDFRARTQSLVVASVPEVERRTTDLDEIETGSRFRPIIGNADPPSGRGRGPFFAATRTSGPSPRSREPVDHSRRSLPGERNSRPVPPGSDPGRPSSPDGDGSKYPLRLSGGRDTRTPPYVCPVRRVRSVRVPFPADPPVR